MRGKSCFILLLAVMIITSCGQKEKPDSVNLLQDFSMTAKSPLGLYTAHEMINLAFPGLELKENKKSFSDFFKKFTEYDYTRSNNVYAVLSKQFYPSDDDVEAITDFVVHGNTFIVAANEFDYTFMDKFHLRVTGDMSLDPGMFYFMRMRETGVSLTDSVVHGSNKYHFFFYPLSGKIERDSSFPSQQIAQNDTRIPGAIVFKYGKGRVIAVNNVVTFTNYFLLTRDNYQYLAKLLSYAQPEATGITWDSYYNKVKSKKTKGYSEFQELMKHPPLVWAFWLFVLGGLLLVIMGLIRRQRMIPIVKENINSSVEFGETVARLYLIKRDNKNLAIKMVTYFLEQIRTKHYINTGTLNQEFAQALASKTGSSQEKVNALLTAIEQVQTQDKVSDLMLLDLNMKMRQVTEGI